MGPRIQGSCESVSGRPWTPELFRGLTFYHPRLNVRQADYWGYTQGRDGRDRLVHCSICRSGLTWSVFIELTVYSQRASALPSIFPCSQSTSTQSGPDLAKILEILAPGSICQRPMAGPLASAKTCFNRLDFNILEFDPVLDIRRSGWLM